MALNEIQRLEELINGVTSLTEMLKQHCEISGNTTIEAYADVMLDVQNRLWKSFERVVPVWYKGHDPEGAKHINKLAEYYNKLAMEDDGA